MNSLAGIALEPRKAKRIPFVPAEVWTNVVPHGVVDVGLNIRLAPGPKVAVDDRGRSTPFNRDEYGTGLDGNGHNRRRRHRWCGRPPQPHRGPGGWRPGRSERHSRLFQPSPAPQFDVALGLDGINVADAPPAWQLEQAGVEGKLFGQVALKAVLRPKGVDLSGSSGEAEVKDGTVQGIPIKALRVVMHARGNSLRFETSTAEITRSAERIRRLFATPNVPFLSLEHGHLWVSLATTRALGDLVASQVTDEPSKQAQGTKRGATDSPHPGGIHLPRSVTTHLELEDVDFAELVARAQVVLGDATPLPIAGQLSLKASVTIPLEKLRAVKDYEFHGTLTLLAASLYGVDIGRVSARFDLAGGVLELLKRPRPVRRPARRRLQEAP